MSIYSREDRVRNPDQPPHKGQRVRLRTALNKDEFFRTRKYRLDQHRRLGLALQPIGFSQGAARENLDRVLPEGFDGGTVWVVPPKGGEEGG